MKPEQGRPATDPDMLSPFEAALFVTAATGIIGSMALRGRPSRRAFWTGTAALVPFVYKMHKREEAWHAEHPELRSSAPIH